MYEKFKALLSFAETLGEIKDLRAYEEMHDISIYISAKDGCKIKLELTEEEPNETV